MKPPSTLAFVLRFYGLEFVGGLATLILALFGLDNFTTDPPDLPFESLISMLGVWPYLIGIAAGAFFAVYAWRRGSALRNRR